jgi:SAM-dependent methyltransferase
MALASLADLFRKYGGDKGSIHSYIDVYEELLAPYRSLPGNVLEIGVFAGNSLRMWEEYFTGAVVWGVDLCEQPLGMVDLRPLIAEGTHKLAFFDAVNQAQASENFQGMTFNVIIEDAGHHIDSQLAIYRNFRDKLAPGGLYIIEDVADLDRDRAKLEAIDPQRQVRILDRRCVKWRFDDVLVVIQ